MAIDTRSLILQMLANRSGVLPDASQLGDHAQVAEADPRINLLMKYLATRQSEANQDEPPRTSDDAETDESPRAPSQMRRPDTSVSARKRMQMESELNMLRERCDTLAAALGACYLCWGTVEGCPACHGLGSPGEALPDALLFREWILPAVQRLRNQRGIRSTDAGPNPSSPPNETSNGPHTRSKP
jgi:hypothetical protein